jgi:hypothetical protein
MYFFAAADDLLDVANLVLDKTDCLLFEANSEINQVLRQLDITDLDRWIALERKKGFVDLVAWSPAMRQKMRISTVELQTPEGGTRQSAIGWGLIQLQLEDVRSGKLRRSSINVNSERRAQRWVKTYADELGPVDAWDWLEVGRTIRRIERLIKTHLVVAKHEATPLLQHAREASESGVVLAQI